MKRSVQTAALALTAITAAPVAKADIYCELLATSAVVLCEVAQGLVTAAAGIACTPFGTAGCTELFYQTIGTTTGNVNCDRVGSFVVDYCESH